MQLSFAVYLSREKGRSDSEVDLTACGEAVYVGATRSCIISRLEVIHCRYSLYGSAYVTLARHLRLSKVNTKPLLAEAIPNFVGELESLLRSEGESDLAEQVAGLRIVDRCRCGDDFCATFYVVPPPSGAWGPGHETVPLGLSSNGMINVDVLDGHIVSIEVLDREDIRNAVLAACP